jgi:hypothetical protein
MPMWNKIIPAICQTLENANIRYHADASSSLFVHGFEFEMDDFDVTVEWSKIESARSAFSEFNPSEISGVSPKKFTFNVSGYAIDVMAYESETGIGPDCERTQVLFSGVEVWSKKPSFYLTRMRTNHPIRSAAFRFFGEKNLSK